VVEVLIRSVGSPEIRTKIKINKEIPIRAIIVCSIRMVIKRPICSFLTNYLENKPMISLSTGACLREAASAKAGERVGVRGDIKQIHLHLYPPPSRGRIMLGNFHGSWVTLRHEGLLNQLFSHRNMCFMQASPNEPE
jgi:hypothetical protein